MPPARKKKGLSASPDQLPTGPVLLGELRTVLGIPLDKIGRTTHRLEAGDVVDEEAVSELSLALGRAIVTSGVVPVGKQIGQPELLIGSAIHFLVRKWDHATMPLRSGKPVCADPRVMMLAAAQLFAVDIAIHVGVWIALLGGDPDRLAGVAVPTIAGTMTDAVERTGLTQGKLCTKLRISATTVRRWRSGSRPRDSAVVAVAQLIEGAPVWTTHVGDLRRQIICAAVIERLATLLPGEDIDGVWKAFTRVARATARFLRGVSEPERVGICRVVIVEGVGEDGAASLIDHLMQVEDDQHWRPPIHSMRDWSRRLRFAHGIAQVVANTSPDFTQALGPHYKLLIDSNLAESTIDFDRLTTQLSRRRPELEAYLQASAETFRGAVAWREGAAAEAVSHLRAAGEHAPAPADRDARLRHVYALAEAGNLREALALASDGADTFDATLMKATLLFSSGALEEGRLELEHLASASEPSAELLVYLGIARWRCDDHGGALKALEPAIDSDEFKHHALVLDIAAECAFKIGNSKKGITWARRANRLGYPRTYLEWRVGKYATTTSRRTSS